MGIVLSCFKGIGKTYLINTQGRNVKISDLSDYGEDYSDFVDRVLEETAKSSIVLVSCGEKERELLDERGVNYDLFYPSKERRKEFIENEVRKHTRSSEIQKLDADFDEMVDSLDDEESERCYKHKLSNFGEFIGNSPIILSYINDEKNKKSNE